MIPLKIGSISRFCKTSVQMWAFAARIGLDWRTKRLLAYSLIGWRYGKKLPFFKPKLSENLPLMLRSRKREFRLYLSATYASSDLLVLYEVFGLKVYELQPTQPPNVIVDLGAYIGISTLYFSNCFPNAKVYAVEPSVQNYERLRRNVDGLPNIFLIHSAIASSSGYRELYLSEDRPCAHSLFPSGDPQKSAKVRCLTLNDLVRDMKLESIDILKFDLEGAEWEVFMDFQSPVPINYLIGELHVDQEQQESLCEAFRRRGYEVSCEIEEFLGVTLYRAVRV